MSTLPGQASKGEKTKPKFQFLDINSLYRHSRGENLEKTQQKSSLTYVKHGMQSLGKVPNARRAPANLPSLKSEHSGTDAAVPLVPPGASGWGKQDPAAAGAAASSSNSPSTPNTSNTPQQQPPSSTQQPANNSQPPPQMSSHQANIALPVTTTIPPQKHPLPAPSSAPTATTDKLWSSVMSGQDPLHPPPYQSPQFQHEFPSLSAGDGGPMRTGSDAQYPSGLSLRPQTEGSWTQGGARPGDAPPRPGSAPLGAQPQLSAPAGPPQQPIPPQFRGVMPSFMYKGNFAPGNSGGIQTQNAAPAVNGRNNRQDNRPPRLTETEEVTPRPIIKEEELSRMDEIGTDMGWAGQDEIDYNQKLAFSDDESDSRKPRREPKLPQQQQHRERDQQSQQQPDRNEAHEGGQGNRGWGRSPAPTRGRTSEEDEVWIQQCRKHTEKAIEVAVQRAIQRKEEEEKRFNEATKQGAQKKLLELEEKISKRNSDHHEGCGTINPMAVPAKPINHVDIPLPDFQKDKERESRSRTPSDTIEDKSPQNRENSFRQLTQIEGKSFPRKNAKVERDSRDSRDRDREMRDQNGPSFSRHFQNDLPPRFLKHRNNSNSNLQQQQQQHYHASGAETNRWQGQNAKQAQSRNVRLDSPEHEAEEVERRDYKRQSSEDSYRSSHHSEGSQKLEGQTTIRHAEEYRREKEEEKWHREKLEHPAREDWHDRREKPANRGEEKSYERPQRPDSRDSRSTRHSRESEGRDYITTWPETTFEGNYDDKRREDRRQVPGPITKERIEADDMRSEKRGLTQLKRGHIIEKKLSDSKKDDLCLEDLESGKKTNKDLSMEAINSTGAWADALPTALDQLEPALDKSNKLDLHKSDAKHFGGELKKMDKSDGDFKDRGGRNRAYPPQQQQNKAWGGASEYHQRPAWQKRPPGRGHKSTGPGRPSSSISGDFHATDSEGSLDEHHSGDKPMKKLDKDDKNRDNKQEKLKSEKKESYVPRGEPSRHGRGGGNFRGSRMSGLSKRIDGYGPPPSKSPFGHHEDKEKKISGDESNQELTSEDKAKQNQQALSAGLVGGRQHQQNPLDKFDKSRKLPDRRLKPRGPPGKKDEDTCDTNSENSDERDGKSLRKPIGKPQQGGIRAPPSGGLARRGNAPPRLIGDKRNYEAGPRGGDNSQSRLNSTSGGILSKKPQDDKSLEQNVLCHAIADISLKNRDDDDLNEDKDDKLSFNGDCEGFQEVKSKKTVKDRLKSTDIQQDKQLGPSKVLMKDNGGKDIGKMERERKKLGGAQLTQQQIQNIPSLMATPINPPPIMPQSKNQFERPRQSKLAPRFAKQKLQKAQMQQHGICDVSDMNKVNQNINVYGMKDGGQVQSSCAWDKPLGSQLRNMDHDMLGVGGMEGVGSKGLDVQQNVGQGPSPNHDKMMGKPSQLQDKTLLDGTTPPVNTIIFENTNFKSAPGARTGRNDKPRSKLDETGMDSSLIGGFNKPMAELLNKNDKQSDSIQLPLSFKEDNGDIKLDFFGSDLSHLPIDDKSSKTLCMAKNMHTITSGNSTICTADSLNIKIASVKKVWETPAEVGQDDGNSSFSNSFVSDPNSLDPNIVFSKGNDTPDDSHEGYSPSPNQTASTTTNVCKVKPTQQVSGNNGPAVLNSAGHQQHSGIVGPGLMGNPLSPPPSMAPVIGQGVGLGQPPQQYPTNQHLGYQGGLGGSNQYGMSAIPSPPTVPAVLYNSTQQLQAQSASLYGAFQIDQSAVLSGQGRSQYSQYANHYGLSQTGSSPYSQQSVYLQATPQHPPPPTAQAPPELYTNMNSYRLSATAPFGQNQQLNNPTTVLISSTSNSLMSASVKPSSQQISAIGTKAGGVGQAYQQQSQQGQQQVYMTYDPSIQANYLSNAGVMQRGPSGPVQNSVVQGLQSSSMSSYYSGSTGGQTGYFQQPGNSNLQSAPLQQHQAGYGLQGNVFGTHNQSHTNAGLQNYNSHFLSTPMQMAAAISAQQYRSGLPTQYMKSVGGQQLGDQNRPQQLKSPSSQEGLSSVFNSGPQIPSPKSKQNCKHPPPQSSPTAQHKYNLYQSVGNHQSGNIQGRYPTPIQRPVNVNYQNLGGQQNNANQKHRSNNAGNKAINRQYYTNQNNSLSSQNEKVDDSKLSDGGSLGNSSSSNNSSNIASKTSLGSGASAVAPSSEIVKDSIGKEENSTLKD